MVRSMYSGVSGLRAHQTRMDTIGNNIANVNTYGFKSGRTTFRDIYYQNLSSAASPTAATGGRNPSQVGYGSQVGSVDVMMGRSTFSMTDQTMDVAIDGDGFLQVQDAEGNIYYTRAGMLNFDSAGYLVDMQGNYVLGVNGNPTGRAPGSERINVNLSSVEPTPASAKMSVNGLEFTVKATNTTKDGNINFNFQSDSSLTDGTKAVATISSNGIVVTFNAKEHFSSMDDINNAVNEAIVAANGGKQHVAGQFNITYTGDPTKDPFLTSNMPAGRTYLTGKEITSTDYNVQLGSVTFGYTGTIFGGITPTGKVGSTFKGDTTNLPMDNFTASYDGTKWNFSLNVAGVAYTGSIDSSADSDGKFNLVNSASGDANDYIEFNRKSFDAIMNAYATQDPTALAKLTTAAPAGLMDVGSMFTLDGRSYEVPAGATVADQMGAIAAKINADGSAKYTATADAAGNLTLTAKKWGIVTAAPNYSYVIGGATTTTASTITNAGGPNAGNAFAAINPQGSATPSAPSYALGLSSNALALRGGTEGGPQTIADMTGIAIGPDGVITGLDSQGFEIIIGRIDIAVFANPAGLTLSGSSNFAASQNSGTAVLTQPGQAGAGQLVTGTLELSNVDLSREFSDMITTQRGYQANSRIITVTDTMLEELINLKR